MLICASTLGRARDGSLGQSAAAPQGTGARQNHRRPGRGAGSLSRRNSSAPIAGRKLISGIHLGRRAGAPSLALPQPTVRCSCRGNNVQSPQIWARTESSWQSRLLNPPSQWSGFWLSVGAGGRNGRSSDILASSVPGVILNSPPPEGCRGELA